MNKKYSDNCSKERGYLVLKAKLFIDKFEKGHMYHQMKFQSPLRPNHKLKGLDYSLIGQIEFLTETFDTSNNGQIVDVILLAGEEHKKIIEESNEWDIDTGIEHFGKLQLVEILGFEE
jgi:hypothetical protein